MHVAAELRRQRQLSHGTEPGQMCQYGIGAGVAGCLA
jgi:hypothetical protein